MTIAVSDEEIVDAEIVPDRHEVEASIERAVGHLGGFWSEVKWQIESRAWEVLGMESFNQLWNERYASLNVGISRAERPELVAAMRGIGQTQQEVADKLGVHRETVGIDLRSMSESDIEVPPIITNSRGQQRPASYKRKPEPEPEPERVDEVPEGGDTGMIHNSPFEVGARLSHETSPMVLVGPDGLAYAPNSRTVQEAIDWARKHPYMGANESCNHTSFRRGALTTAYAALRKNREIDAEIHIERPVGDLFDVVAMGVQGMVERAREFWGRLEEGEREDFEYSWREFDDAMKELNKFRKDIKQIHGFK